MCWTYCSGIFGYVKASRKEDASFTHNQGNATCLTLIVTRYPATFFSDLMKKKLSDNEKLNAEATAFFKANDKRMPKMVIRKRKLEDRRCNQCVVKSKFTKKTGFSIRLYELFSLPVTILSQHHHQCINHANSMGLF